MFPFTLAAGPPLCLVPGCIAAQSTDCTCRDRVACTLPTQHHTAPAACTFSAHSRCQPLSACGPWVLCTMPQRHTLLAHCGNHMLMGWHAAKVVSPPSPCSCHLWLTHYGTCVACTPTAHLQAKREEQCANPEQSSVLTAADKPGLQDPAPGPGHATLRGCPPAALLPRVPITCARLIRHRARARRRLRSRMRRPCRARARARPGPCPRGPAPARWGRG